MATVVLPRSLVVLFPGAERRVAAEGATVGQVIESLDRRWPGVRDRLCQRSDALREFINVYVDGRPAGLDTPVGPGGTVHILPAVAGGQAPT
jgi:sulfur-carrier protein